MKSSTRVALVGCGAAAEQLHLPALASLGRPPALLVDTNRERLLSLQSQCGAGAVAGSHLEALDSFDAAIVAVPNNLHARVCVELLESGKHVLVEKPMALTRAEGESMMAAAQAGRAVLAVGLVRRYLQSARWVKRALEHDVLGKLHSVDVREGHELDWAIASDRFYSRTQVGGGVFADLGAHTLDVLLWWVGEAVRDVEFKDDSAGGVEADGEMRVVFHSGVEAVLELSRTRFLRNTARFKGEKGTIEVSVNSNTLRAEPAGLLALSFDGLRGDRLDPQEYKSLFALELQDWLTSIDAGSKPSVSGDDGLAAVDVMERAYAKRMPIDFPWVRAGSNSATASFKQPLVTGASGFIGGRLLEKLALEHHITPRVQFRNYSHASRIFRFDLESICGNLANATVVDRAVAGRDVVFHCAQDWYQASANLDAARLLAEACLKHSVKRLVYVSSFVVYAPFPDGNLDETASIKSGGWDYADNKRAVEELFLSYARERGLPVVILQPTVVYGPYSQGWSIELATKLMTGRVVLPDGAGTSNAVYVDDVAEVLLLAAQAPGVAGERFLIAGGEPLPWREYCAGYERELGVQSVVTMPLADYRSMFHGTGRSATVQSIRMDPRKIIQSIVPKAAIQWGKRVLGNRVVDQVKRTVPPTMYKLTEMPVEALMTRPVVVTDKARKRLGFVPQFNFERGMNVTGEFLRRSYA